MPPKPRSLSVSKQCEECGGPNPVACKVCKLQLCHFHEVDGSQKFANFQQVMRVELTFTTAPLINPILLVNLAAIMYPQTLPVRQVQNCAAVLKEFDVKNQTIMML